MMTWYWLGIIGGIIAPWIAMTRSLRSAFESGLQQGLGAWLGMSALTIPAMLLIMWIITKIGS